MVGKQGGKPPPSAGKAFNSAASGKPQQEKPKAYAARMMSPSPGGMSGGPRPPLGAKVAADRKQFAQQLANAKAKANAESNSKSVAAKPKTTSKAFNKQASSGRAKATFNSASKTGGKGGRAR